MKDPKDHLGVRAGSPLHLLHLPNLHTHTSDRSGLRLEDAAAAAAAAAPLSRPKPVMATVQRKEGECVGASSSLPPDDDATTQAAIAFSLALKLSFSHLPFISQEKEVGSTPTSALKTRGLPFECWLCACLRTYVPPLIESFH